MSKISNIKLIALTLTFLIVLQLTNVTYSAVPQDGLVTYINFDNGILKDESTGDSTYETPTGQFGPDRNGANNAYVFNGSESVRFPPQSFDSKNSAFSFWVKAISNVNAAGILDRVDLDNDHGHIIHFNGSNNICYSNRQLDEAAGFFTSATYKLTYECDTSTAYTDDKWHHVAINYSNDNGQVVFYVDGIKTTTLTAKDSFGIVSKTLYIGYDRTYEKYFQGSLDDIAIYNRSLTEEEIKTLSGKVTTNSGVVVDLTQYDIYTPKIFSATTAVRTDEEKNFVKVEFTNFFDNRLEAELESIKITRLPTQGKVTFLGSDVTVDQVIPTTAAFDNNLVYKPNAGFTGKDNFLWTGRSVKGKNYSLESSFSIDVINDAKCENNTYRASEINPNCVSSCGSSTFSTFDTIFGNICKSCSANCTECQSESNCLKCQANYFISNGFCTQQCPDGSYPSNGSCLTSPNCVQGSYFDFEANSCRNCSLQNCIDCSSAVACNKCDPTFSLTKFDSSNSSSFGVEGSSTSIGVSGSQSNSLAFEGQGCVNSSALLAAGARYLSMGIGLLVLSSAIILI